MNEEKRNRLAAALSRLTLTLHKDLAMASLDRYGEPVSVLDVFEQLFEHCDMDRIEAACEDVLNNEEFFPAPATLMRYYRANAPTRTALPPADDDRQRTPEEKARLHLTLEYWIYNPNNADDFEAAKAELSSRGMEQYIKDHWARGLKHVKSRMQKSGNFTTDFKRVAQ